MTVTIPELADQDSRTPDKGAIPMSVVMPVHNNVRFVEQAIESLLSQTLLPDEILVGDDGSDDGTSDILARMASQHDRIRVLRRDQKSGLVSAGNWIVREARHEIVAIAHGDDLSAPDRLAEQYAVLQNNVGSILVGSPAIGIDVRGAKVHSANLVRILRPGVFAPFAHSSIMFKRSVFDQAGGYRQGTDYWEDADLYWRMAPFGRMFFIPRALCSYRYSEVSSRSRDHAEKVELAIEKMYCRAQEIEDQRKGGAPLKPSMHSELKCHPRVFVARSWVDVWNGQPTPVFGRLIRKGRLAFNWQSAVSLGFVGMASLMPKTLRLAVQCYHAIGNFRISLRSGNEREIEWSPLK